MLLYYLDNFQYQQALDYIDTQTPTTGLLLKKVSCYKSLGEYYKAIEVLKPLSKENPENIQVKSELASCYEALGQRQVSIACYDELIQLDSTNLYFKKQKADLIYQQGQYSKSLDIFREIYNQNDSPTMLKRMAQCFEKMEQPDSARTYYMEAWERNPKDGFAAANLVNTTLKIGFNHEAIAYSEKFMEIDSTDTQVNLLNALAYYRLDDYETAVVKFTKCHERGDSSLIVNRSLGIALYSLNNSSQARPYLEAAYRQDTTNNNVLYCLAIAYKDMSDYELAIPLLQKLLDRTIPPDLTLYLYYRNLAESYSKWREHAKGAVQYENALKYAGEDQKMNVYYILANLNEYSLRNRKKALEYYKLYKDSLVAYIERLKKKDVDETEEINRTSKMLTDLEDFIKKLGVSGERK
jgi:tetratricopeptide (TPR) repeat protein